jgi:uncharacterized protein
MFPLGTVLFPELPLLLHVFEPRYRALVRDCLSSDHQFGVVLITRGSEVGGGDQRAPEGTVAHIEGARPLPDGRWVLAARGQHRISVVQWLPEDPYPCALVRDDQGEPWPSHVKADRTAPSPTGAPSTLGPGGAGAPEAGASAPWPADLRRAETAVRRCRALLSELSRSSALPPDLSLAGDPVAASWQLCGLSPVTAFDAQRLLEVDQVAQRMHLLITMMDQLSEDLTRMLGEAER